MILTPNVPKSVRNWALCRTRARDLEHSIEQASKGYCFSLGSYWALKSMGRKKFCEEVVEPELRRMERRRRHYLALAEAIEGSADPQRYLLGKTEMLEMIGHTLHFTKDRKETFLTLTHCSSDGEYLFGPGDGDLAKSIDALTLLSFGFGRSF